MRQANLRPASASSKLNSLKSEKGGAQTGERLPPRVQKATTKD